MKLKEYIDYLKKLETKYGDLPLIYSIDDEYISELEKRLHKENKEFKYIPELKFAGMQECFSEIIFL